MILLQAVDSGKLNFSWTWSAVSPMALSCASLQCRGLCLFLWESQTTFHSQAHTVFITASHQSLI